MDDLKDTIGKKKIIQILLSKQLFFFFKIIDAKKQFETKIK